MAKDHMTIDDLAHALRGMPRDAVLLIDTPDGPQPLRMCRGAHARRRDDGGVEALANGASTVGEVGYAIILATEHR
jgi:hypothetical protein